ncbi:hypothetical protein [Laribacter hongkongensis]|uniref:hypothetical protein n=1 Tax=Laribacter hongkongensis TaxID=168471 RepID=UPI000482ACE8|nr:hypothetical protein [Laribacter hongkongensis]
MKDLMILVAAIAVGSGVWIGIKRLMVNKNVWIARAIAGVATFFAFFITIGIFVDAPEQQAKQPEKTQEAVAQADTKPEPQIKAQQKKDKPSLDDVAYEIASERSVGDVKRIEVTLHQRIDEPTLKLLAEKIKSEYAKSNPALIFYRLDGAPSSGAWATTHYQPDQKIEIKGISQSEFEAVLASDESVPGKKLGVWIELFEPAKKLIAYTDKGKTFIRSVFADGATLDGKYVLSSRDGKKILTYHNEDSKEVFKAVNANGDLEYWNELGNYYTAPKFEKPKAAD